MRVLLWHGWLLSGSGSNVYTARVAEALRREGHDVVLICQEPHPERSGFIDQAGPVDEAGPAPGLEHGPGRCVLLRPEIGGVLPVFVVDEYEGFEVKRFVDLTDGELGRYLDANVAALRAAAAWHRPDVVIGGHAVPGAVVAHRALGPGRYLAKVHGSDLEYAIRDQPRYIAMAKESLEGAVAVIGASKDVVARALEFAPRAKDRVGVIAPGVDVERFHPRSRGDAIERLARLLDADPETARGRPASLDRDLAAGLHEWTPSALEEMATRYDRDVPDPEAAARLRALAERDGPVVGSFGKLIPQKGVNVFLQAVALAGGGVRALVVGFGSFREALAAQAIALDRGDPEALRRLSQAGGTEAELADDEVAAARGFGRRVTFTGRLDHRYAPFALAAMDILVVPSILDEAFGMVAAEGAACGALPLVAGHSGLAEVAEALEAEVGRPGLFSYQPGPGSAHRMAEGMGRLLALPAAQREDLSRAISEFVAREWTWGRTAARLLVAATEPLGAGSRQAVRPDGSR